jgi:hypothetical protein
VQESIRFKNSDLRSKCPNGTGYILQVAKQILEYQYLESHKTTTMCIRIES